jgi:hypothetical protein
MQRFVRPFSVKDLAKLLLAFVYAGVLVPRADAHALGAECRIRDNHVEFEAYYSDDTPARHAKVEVQDSAGKVIAAGETDDVGRWTFALPPAGEYQVAVDAGMGHRKTLALQVPSNGSPQEQASLPASEEPGRKEFTRVPWLRITYGFAIIGILAIALHLWQRRTRISRPS